MRKVAVSDLKECLILTCFNNRNGIEYNVIDSYEEKAFVCVFFLSFLKKARHVLFLHFSVGFSVHSLVRCSVCSQIRGYRGYGQG